MAVSSAPNNTEFTGGETVEVELCTNNGECVDTSRVDVRPADIAAVDFVAPPVDGKNSLALSYELAEDYEVDRFVSLRLYIKGGSSWGIHLGELELGDDSTSTFQIMPDELGVPFETDRQLEVAIVDSTDPYGRDPLAAADSVTQSVPTEGRIEGTVRNVDGDLSEGVEVAVSGVGSISFKTTTTTDATGMYSVEVEAGHTYKVAPTGDEFNSGSTEVTVGADKTHVVDIELTRGDSEQIGKYTGEDGTVDADGLNNAFNDWQTDEIDAELLQRVFNAWQHGGPVA